MTHPGLQRLPVSTRNYPPLLRSTYRTWCKMRERCTNPKIHGWKNYGGRGIRFCERWSEFELFLADMGEKPSLGHSLDRYPNPAGNYEPGNCRWATRIEQRSTQRLVHPVTWRGETKTLPQWARIVGVGSKTLWRRIWVSGWDIERAMTTPTRIQPLSLATLCDMVAVLDDSGKRAVFRALGGMFGALGFMPECKDEDLGEEPEPIL